MRDIRKLLLKKTLDTVDRFITTNDTGFYAQKPEKEEVLRILNNLDNSLIKNFDLLNNSNCIIFDSAGIGDLVHSRLVVQHIRQIYTNIAWMVPPITKSLYKDDNLVKVIDGCYIKYRNPGGNLEKCLIELVNFIIRTKFPQKKLINIPRNVLLYLTSGRGGTYPQIWHNSCRVQRNSSIKHKLIHNGNLQDLNLNLKKKFILIEYCCLGSPKPSLDTELLSKFIEKMKTIDIDCVYVGSKDDPKIDNGIDCRGFSLYDTFTLLKNSVGMIGRGSGNECLCAFHPNIPIFEIDAQASMKNGEYVSPNLTHVLNQENYIDYIYRYFSDDQLRKIIE